MLTFPSLGTFLWVGGQILGVVLSLLECHKPVTHSFWAGKKNKPSTALKPKKAVTGADSVVLTEVVN